MDRVAAGSPGNGLVIKIVRIEIENICWRAPAASHDVLTGVTFTAAAGELIALMGRKGAGKSTLLDVIAALREPRAGEVRLETKPLQAWTPRARARAIAHLPQIVRPDL